jgi:hypothetical protein
MGTEWWTARARDPQLPLFLRVLAWTMAHADSRGHAHAHPEQVRHETSIGVDLAPSQISRAIRRCVTAGLLAPESHAWHLVLAQVKTPAPSRRTSLGGHQ